MPSRYFSFISRNFSSSSSIRKLSKIPSKYRARAIKEAQNALTDYLHGTKNLSFTYAEHISKNSHLSLFEIMDRVKFSSSGFSGSLQKFLRYYPINEFEFFYESIGIDYDEIDRFLPVNKFFLAEDYHCFDVACALSVFGFPWNKLGMLYKEESSIFDKDLGELNQRLAGLKKDYGFDSVVIIGVCLAFPFVLSRNCDVGGEIDGLFDDLKKVFVDYDLVSYVEGNVDAWFEVCRKIRIFYDLGCTKGEMGKLMGRSKNVFLDYPVEILLQKIEFFSRLAVSKEEIGYLLLSKLDILKFDLETPCISVSGFLKYMGLEQEKLRLVMETYPYVLGRNKISNLPRVMRSLDLHKWFFNKMKNGDHNLLGTYIIGSPDEDFDKSYTDHLVRIRSSRLHVHTFFKLDFLHGIGFGENKLTMKVLPHMHGTSSELQDRFDCLLHCGIEFSKLCKMISWSPKIMNQEKELIEQKVKYLREEIGYSLEYLHVFPALLCYNLEKRIKSRYKFHMWLTENHLCTKEYSLSSIVSTSEKSFIAQIYRMHPAAPKKWLESYLNKNPDN